MDQSIVSSFTFLPACPASSSAAVRRVARASPSYKSFRRKEVCSYFQPYQKKHQNNLLSPIAILADQNVAQCDSMVVLGASIGSKDDRRQ
eukprot:scaffold269_cov245-Chaetoceros_neogracile.AAC.9